MLKDWRQVLFKYFCIVRIIYSQATILFFKKRVVVLCVNNLWMVVIRNHIFQKMRLYDQSSHRNAVSKVVFEEYYKVYWTFFSRMNICIYHIFVYITFVRCQISLDFLFRTISRLMWADIEMWIWFGRAKVLCGGFYCLVYDHMYIIFGFETSFEIDILSKDLLESIIIY